MSMNAKQSVTIVLSVSAALILCGCDNATENNVTVTPATHQTAGPNAAAAIASTAMSAADDTKPAAKPAAKPEGKQAPNPQASPGSVNLSDREDQPRMIPLAPPETSDPTKAAQVPPPKPVSDPLAPILVVAEPTEIDFGEIPTSDSKTAKVKLVNTGDKPMTINSARASCGCTALKVVPGTVLQPGESTEVEVRLSAPSAHGIIQHKTVTFIVEGQPELVVPLKGMAISFVLMEPATLDVEKNADGKFKLTSADGQPFRVTGVQPPVISGLPTEAAAEHELVIDFTKYREIGVSRKTVMYVDHPKCQQIFANITFTPEDYAKQAEITRKQNADRLPKDAAAAAAAAAMADEAMPLDVQLADMIKTGKNAEVMEKIRGGLEVNHRDSSGSTLLAVAAKNGNVELMSALLNAGADKEAQDNVGRTPLMNAAQSKNAAAVQALLDAGVSITARDAIGGTALSWASGLGDSASVQELIDAGADVEIVGSVTGWTPLIWAAGFGDPASIPMLVKAGANLEAADFLQGATPLIHAARTGRIEGVKSLIAAGAKIENTDKTGKTPLLAACETAGGTADKIQALIDAGANLKATDSRGLNALDLAQKRTDMRAPDVVVLLEKYIQPTAAPATPAAHDHDDHAGHDHSH
jgi:ankyrin repeat protein